MRKGRDLSAKLKATYASKAFSVMGNGKATEFVFNGAQLIGVSWKLNEIMCYLAQCLEGQYDSSESHCLP